MICGQRRWKWLGVVAETKNLLPGRVGKSREPGCSDSTSRTDRAETDDNSTVRAELLEPEERRLPSADGDHRDHRVIVRSDTKIQRRQFVQMEPTVLMERMVLLESLERTEQMELEPETEDTKMGHRMLWRLVSDRVHLDHLDQLDHRETREQEDIREKAESLALRGKQEPREMLDRKWDMERITVV